MDPEKIINLYKSIPYDFRWAKLDEWKPAMLMVWKTFMKFEASDYTEEGVKNFFEFITDDDVYRAFLNGSYKVLLALDGNRIIGVGTLRNINMLSLLFVDEEYHRQGVGRVIIELLASHVKDDLGEHVFHVKSAPYAVDFYKKTGFIAVSGEQERDGIRVTPMERIL